MCAVDGCARDAHCRGWCPTHYSRWARHGDPLGGGPTKPRPFWSYVDASGGIDACWNWVGGKNADGYGMYSRPRRGGKVRAHRFALSQAVGYEIPTQHGVHHQCDNPACCNPLHLTHDVQVQNVREMVQRGRSAKGERHSQAKLTEDQAVRIITKREDPATLANEFGVTRQTIYDIRSGIRWKHLHNQNHR